MALLQPDLTMIDKVKQFAIERHTLGIEVEFSYIGPSLSTPCEDCYGDGEVEQECNLGHYHYVECDNCDGEGYLDNYHVLPAGWSWHEEHCGIEFVSHVYQPGITRWEQAKADIRHLVREAIDLGADWGGDNGVHIHVGAPMNAKFMRNALRLWYRVQRNVLDAFGTTPHRENQWASPHTVDDLRAHFWYIANNQQLYDRYFALNIGAMWRYGTLEFRLFNGYADSDYITQAAEFSRFFVEVACLFSEKLINQKEAVNLILEYLEGVR